MTRTHSLTMLLSVACGGALTPFFAMSSRASSGIGSATGFPFGTLVVNVAGLFVLGALVETMALVWSPAPEIRASIVVGVLGAFTTFSTFSLDAYSLLAKKDYPAAGFYVFGSVFLGACGFCRGLDGHAAPSSIMIAVTTVTVAAGDDGARLDHWFKRHYPGLGLGRLQKLLRTGQIRVDGGRVKSGHRVSKGKTIRILPLGDLERLSRTVKRTKVSKEDQRAVESMEFCTRTTGCWSSINRPDWLFRVVPA